MSTCKAWKGALVLGGIGLVSCDGGSSGESPAVSVNGELAVVAVNEPLACFARRIGGALVDARCPAPADVDPAFWEPDDEELLRIQAADLILLNGAGYARWVATASLPESKLVDTSTAFADRLVEVEGDVVHSHGPEGEHSHGAVAFTTWLDLELAVAHAGAVRAALAARLGGHADALSQRHEALAGELRELDDALKRWGASLDGAPLLASHPVYQYLARAYGLDVESVHWEPGTTPPAEEWDALAALLERHPATWMLWEGEPSPDTAARLEQLGVRCVVFDPCGAPPEDGDLLSVLRANLERLRAAGCGSF